MFEYINIVSLDEEIVVLWMNWLTDTQMPELFSNDIIDNLLFSEVLESDSTYKERKTFIVRYILESEEKYKQYKEIYEPLAKKQFFGSYLGYYSISRYFCKMF